MIIFFVTVCIFTGILRADTPAAAEEGNAPQKTEIPDGKRDPAEISRLVRDLADPSWKIRDHAGRRLVEFGSDAEDALLEAAESDDPTVAAAAKYFFSFIQTGLIRFSDSPELKILLEKYLSGAFDPQKITILDVIAKMSQDYVYAVLARKIAILDSIAKMSQEDAYAALVRIANSEADVQNGEYAVLMLLWYLPVETEFPSLLAAADKPVTASSPAGDSPGTRNSQVRVLSSPALSPVAEPPKGKDGQNAESPKTELLNAWLARKPWMEKRLRTVEDILQQAKTVRHKKSPVELLIKYLEKEQEVLARILSVLNRGEAEIPDELSGEKIQNTYSEMLAEQIKNISQAARVKGTVIQVGFSYYTADFLDQLGFSQDAELLLAKIRNMNQVSHASINSTEFLDRFFSVDTRIHWIKNLLARGHFSWGVEEGEKLWASCQPTEISLVSTFLANTYHTLGNDKRAAELMLDILSTPLRRKGLEALRKLLAGGSEKVDTRKILDEFTSQAKFYQACVAAAEKDIPRQKKLLRESLEKYPANCDSLILGYELGKTDQDPVWSEEMEKKIENVLAKTEETIRQIPDDEALHEQNQYAWLAVKTNRHLEKAARYAELNVIHSPESGSVRDTLAHIYFAAGHVDAAILHQERALRDEPDALEIRKNLEVFFAMKKQMDAEKEKNP